MVHSRVKSTSWPLANSVSTSASEMVWNARSQAAYQGHSHLTGIMTTSALLTWRLSALRARPGGGAG